MRRLLMMGRLSAALALVLLAAPGPGVAQNFGQIPPKSRLANPNPHDNRTAVPVPYSTFDPMEYGAKCNAAISGGGTDDTQAINDMFADIRAWNQPFRVVQPGGKYCYITGSINATGLKNGPGTMAPSEIELRLDCQTHGKPCIDALGSRFVRWDKLRIHGEAANSPNIGLLYGRGDPAGSNADVMTFDTPYIDGSYTLTAVYNFASEGGLHITPWYENDNNTLGAYAFVGDACNHAALTSQFVTMPAANTCFSYNNDHFINPTFWGNIPIWFSAARHLMFDGGYGVSLGEACGGVLYDQYGGTGTKPNFLDLKLDFLLETFSGNPISDAFCLQSANTGFELDGFEYRISVMLVSNSIFKLNPSITGGAKVSDLNLKIEAIGAGVKVFDNPAAWTVNGIDAFLPGNMFPSGTPPGMYGRVCAYQAGAPAVNTCTNYGPVAFNDTSPTAPTPAVADNSTKLATTAFVKGATAATPPFPQNAAPPTRANTGLTGTFNLGANSVADGPGGIVITSPSAASVNFAGVCGAYPPPYTIQMGFTTTQYLVADSNYWGVSWGVSGTLLQAFNMVNHNGMWGFEGERWSNYTTGGFLSADVGNLWMSAVNPAFFQIENDGTNVSYGFSGDGRQYTVMYSAPIAGNYLPSASYNTVCFDFANKINSAGKKEYATIFYFNKF